MYEIKGDLKVVRDLVVGRAVQQNPTVVNGATAVSAVAGGLYELNLTGPISINLPAGAANGSVVTVYDGAATINGTNSVTPVAAAGDSVSGLPVSGKFTTSGDVIQLRYRAADSSWLAVSLASGGAGSTTFIGLTDTPAALGASGETLVVNAAGTALEFAAPGATPIMSGASNAAAGSTGTVPVPAAGTQDLPLKGDGTFESAIPAWASGGTYSVGAIVSAIDPADSTAKVWRRVTANVASESSFNATEAARWTAIADLSGVGVTTFTGLSDTPAGFAAGAADAGKQVVVNAAGNALEFAAPSVVSGMTGATDSAAGAAGVVPTPPAGSQDLALYGDGNFSELLPDWVTGYIYSVGAVVVATDPADSIKKIWRRVTANTASAATFSADKANWTAIAALGGAGGRSVQTLTPGASVTFDVSNGEIGTLAIASTSTISVSNAAAGGFYTVIASNGGSSSFALSVSGLVDSAGNSVGSVSVPASGTLAFDIYSPDGTALVLSGYVERGGSTSTTLTASGTYTPAADLRSNFGIIGSSATPITVTVSPLSGADQSLFDPTGPFIFRLTATGGGATSFAFDTSYVGESGGIGTITLASGSVRTLVFVRDNTTGSVRLVADSANTSKLDISDWVANTGYAAGDVAVTPGGALVKRNADGTSGSAFDATEAGNWTVIGSGVDGFSWTANTYYYANQLGGGAPSANGTLISRKTDGVSGATFDATEAAAWSHAGQVVIAGFQANTVYLAGELVFDSGRLFMRLTDGQSGASLASDGQTAWRQLTASNVGNWAAATDYEAGTVVITPTGALVYRTTKGTSGAAFDATEAGTWTILNAEFQTKAYLDNTYYYQGQTASRSDSSTALSMRRTGASGVTGASFDATEGAKWELLNQSIVYAWTNGKTYLAGEQAVYRSELLIRGVTGVSAGTNATDFPMDSANWFNASTNATKTLDEYLPSTLQPTSGSGALGQTASFWADGHSYIMGDSDAAVATQWTLAFPGLALAAGDTYRFRIQLAVDEVAANHVVEFAIHDGNGGAATDAITVLVEISGAAGPSVLSVVDAGGSTMTGAATTTIIDRGANRLLQVDIDLNTTGTVAAAQMAMAIKPVFNLTGTTTEVASSTGSIVLHNLFAGSQSEFITQVAPMTSQTLTEVTSVTWDTALGEQASLAATGTVTDIAAPTNLTAGKFYHLDITASGDQTINFNPIFVDAGNNIVGSRFIGSGTTSVTFFYNGSKLVTTNLTDAAEFVADSITNLPSARAFSNRVGFITSKGQVAIGNGGVWQYMMSENGEAVISTGSAVDANALIDLDVSPRYQLRAITSTGPFTVSAQNMTAHTGTLVRLDFSNISTSGPATWSFDSNSITDKDGQALPNVVLPAADGTTTEQVVTYTFRVQSAGNVLRLVQQTPVLSSSGLTARGDATADPAPALLNSIYGANASGGAFDFTLPAATGSQGRIELLGVAVATNAVTIKVQAGEAMNDTTNGTFTLNTDGQRLMMVDRATGKWDVLVVGAGATTTLANGVVTTTADLDIGPTAVGIGNYEDATPTTGPALSVTVPSAGRWHLTAVIRGRSVNADDGAGVYGIITDSANNEVQDGTASWSHRILDSGAASSFTAEGTAVLHAYVTTTGSATYKVRVGQASDTPQNLLVAGSSLRYEQVPSDEAVLAGMVTPTPLHHWSIYHVGDTTLSGNTFLFNAPTSEIDPNGLRSSGNITIAQAGRYRLSLDARVNAANTSSNIFISVDGTTVAQSSTQILGGGTTADGTSCSTYADLSVGQVVTFHGSGTPSASPVNNITASVSQIPSSTVIDPGSTPVTEWQTFTPTISAVTTAPTLATTHSISGMYKVVGKSLHLSFAYAHGSNAGAASGVGEYRFPIPAGFSIDTAKVDALQLVGSFAYATPVGSAAVMQNSIVGAGYVAVADGTNLAVVAHQAATSTGHTVIGSAFYPLATNDERIIFTAEVPIL